MLYKVTGRHVKVGTSLREHVERQLDAAVGKYSLRPIEANVTFAKEPNGISCEVSVHLSTGLTTQSKFQSDTAQTAFDVSCDRLEKQLRRYKRRLKNHHNERTTPVAFSDEPSYILASQETELEENEPDTLHPVIVAELETRIPTVAVGEAVMQMDLAEAPLLVFRNERHGGINVVYRRDDGNIGWIDPKTD